MDQTPCLCSFLPSGHLAPLLTLLQVSPHHADRARVRVQLTRFLWDVSRFALVWAALHNLAGKSGLQPNSCMFPHVALPHIMYAALESHQVWGADAAASLSCRVGRDRLRRLPGAPSLLIFLQCPNVCGLCCLTLDACSAAPASLHTPKCRGVVEQAEEADRHCWRSQLWILLVSQWILFAPTLFEGGLGEQLVGLLCDWLLVFVWGRLYHLSDPVKKKYVLFGLIAAVRARTAICTFRGMHSAVQHCFACCLCCARCLLQQGSQGMAQCHRSTHEKHAGQ